MTTSIEEVVAVELLALGLLVRAQAEDLLQ